MTQQSAQTEESAFEQWLRATHSPAHARRTAQRNAAFFLPHLKPEMRLLDAGCGPGSITIGLADAVAPGETVGIDASPEAIAAARDLASSRDAANVRFEVADIHALPFDDASFDAAFVHAVLQHLPDPLLALRELRRVLKPGGVIGIADADHDGGIIAPPDPLLDRAGEIATRMKQSPLVGKHLRSLLHEADFARSVGSASVGVEGTAEATRMAGEWQARYFEAPAFVEHVTCRGWASADELSQMAAAWRAWGADPGAFAARYWCEAVGWVVES
jgi:ubiquinone/menaquinone biosynthesis C-methylase UbiE